MPRICTSDGSPLDFCCNCFPDEDRARRLYCGKSEGPDNRGDCFEYAPEHPAYDGEETYRCHRCDALLEELDN